MAGCGQAAGRAFSAEHAKADALRHAKPIERPSSGTLTFQAQPHSFYGNSVWWSVPPDRFDPAKDAANRAKHGLSLVFGDRIAEDGNHLIIPSIRQIDGEERFKMVGMVEGKLFMGVFVWRNDLPRFISVRRSNDLEETAYQTAG